MCVDRSGGDGARIQDRSGDDDLHVLRRGPHDPGHPLLLVQLLVPVGPGHIAALHGVGSLLVST